MWGYDIACRAWGRRRSMQWRGIDEARGVRCSTQRSGHRCNGVRPGEETLYMSRACAGISVNSVEVCVDASRGVQRVIPMTWQMLCM